jgi:hypothetical protein
VDSPVTDRVVQELERRGFGSTVANWIAHSIEAHGLPHTIQSLSLTLWDVKSSAEIDQYNHEVITQALANTSKRRNPPTG